MAGPSDEYAPLTVEEDKPGLVDAPCRPGTWAIIVAAGNGSRFGRRKQFAPLHGRPVLAWSLDVARRICAGVVVVVPDGDDVIEGAAEAGLDLADKVVVGGASRSESVRAGLAAVPDDAEVVAVHDAARPLAGLGVWVAALDAVSGGADGAIPVVVVTDTITRVTPDGAHATLDRTELRAVQTPQAFRAEALRRAHRNGADATDDAALVVAAGGRVVLVEGHAGNLKITTPSDLAVAAALLAEGFGR